MRGLPFCASWAWKLTYFRSTSHFEVDFILEGKTAIEVKTKASVKKSFSESQSG